MPWAQFVADGVFYAELNELLNRELAEDGYSGVEVRVTPMRTEIIIRATRTQNVLGRDSIGGERVATSASRFGWDVAASLNLALLGVTARRREGPPHPRAHLRCPEAL